MCFISTKWWSNNRSFAVAFLIFLFYWNNGTAQLIQTQRHETLLGDNDLFVVAPAKDLGVFVYRGLETTENAAIEISFLDTAFQQKWHGFITFEKGYVITGKAFLDSTLFFILHYRDFSKNDLKIIALHCKHGSYMTYNIKNFIPFYPVEFHVTQEAALIGGYFNSIPVVLYYNLLTKKSSVLPGLFNEPGELTQIKTYPDGSFVVLISAKNLVRKKTIWIRNYDHAGVMMQNVLLEPGDNKNLIFGRSIKTPDNRQIVAGVYSTNASEYSRGIFVANISQKGTQELRYYNYGDLHNFFKYMRAPHEARVKSRIERRRIKGRKLRFNYRLLVHELIAYNNQFILLGEAFYPNYSNMSNSGYTIGQNRRFEGYSYTHAVLMGFDTNGKLLWDNSFEINDIRTFALDQFVKIDPKKDKIALHYLFNNEIRSKIIKGSSVLEGKTFDPIKLNHEDDIMRKNDTEISKLEYWYKNYFVAYGIQHVTNIHNGINTKRRVFFINKISYR